jgi:excinuclease ABC subunit C
MVVFIGGQPAPSHYRRYRLQSVAEPNDYAFMKEVLRRRLLKTEMSDKPDLLLIDGGKGQLNIAAAVLAELDLKTQIAVAAIAKKDETKGEAADKVYLAGRVNPVDFSRDGELLLLLQRIRDEAHRFAISFHRRRHRRASLRSALDGISGIGPKRKAALLKHFGTLRGLREASIEQLSTVAGMNRKVAESLKAALDNSRKAL